MSRPLESDELEAVIDSETLRKMAWLMEFALDDFRKTFSITSIVSKEPRITYDDLLTFTMNPNSIGRWRLLSTWLALESAIDILYSNIGEEYPSIWDDLFYLHEKAADENTLVWTSIYEDKYTVKCGSITEKLWEADFMYWDETLELCKEAPSNRLLLHFTSPQKKAAFAKLWNRENGRLYEIGRQLIQWGFDVDERDLGGLLNSLAVNDPLASVFFKDGLYTVNGESTYRGRPITFNLLMNKAFWDDLWNKQEEAIDKLGT